MSRGERTVSWRELLAETEVLLADAPHGSRQHARWICETATSSTPDEFRELLDELAGERAVAHLDAMVQRACTGEPIQYVLGSWSFRRLDLAVDHRVLIPRPETELIAEVAIDLARSFGPTRSVLDLGTGSGAIGLSMADELPLVGTSVWLTDASADAVAVARANLAGIGRAAQNVRIGEGSWFAAIPPGERFDVIVSNPPYVADGSADTEKIVTDWEPPTALFAGPDGLDDLRVIISEAPEWLVQGGWLIVRARTRSRACRVRPATRGRIRRRRDPARSRTARPHRDRAPSRLRPTSGVGSGKSETGKAIAAEFAQHGVGAVLLRQDDSFVSLPASNDARRREDDTWTTGVRRSSRTTDPD